MNGQSTINHPTNHNEQLIGKFHVVNVDKIPSHDETANNTAGSQQLPPVSSSSSTVDESACASRFQMIRVDRNFSRGRWKVNDYEPPENLASSTNPPVNTIENEPVNISNSTNLSTIPATSAVNAIQNNIPSNLLSDSNAASSATLAATAASAAAATATAFQRMTMNNPAAMVPQANVPPPAGLLHPYPPSALANMTAPNQPYLLANHPQFGYYPYYPPPPYSPYAAQWAALAAANPYLPPPIPPSQLSTGNLGDPLRLADGGQDTTSENNSFPNGPNDPLQNAQLAAAAASFIYAAHHPHAAYVSQPPPGTASPYATIPAYHPAQPPPTIIPPPTQPLSLAQVIPNNTTDIQQQQQQQFPYQAQVSQQPAPILTSPKHETAAAKNPTQQSAAPKPTATATPVKTQGTASNGINIDTLKTANPTHITDLLSSSPSIPNSQQPPPSLLSPITVQGTNPTKSSASVLTDMWPYQASGSPLNITQTAAATAVAAMGILNNENSQTTEMANEILKELTTPTKQNITTDIDNKISAAMDLVKMHLLSAVREEVTDLRQQIRTLNEKVNSVEHENAFLRQHVPSEIYAQYTPLTVASSAVNDPANPSSIGMATAPTVPLSSVTSSQPIPMTSLSSLPLSLAQQPPASTNSQTVPVPPQPPPSSSTNLPAV